MSSWGVRVIFCPFTPRSHQTWTPSNDQVKSILLVPAELQMFYVRYGEVYHALILVCRSCFLIYRQQALS